MPEWFKGVDCKSIIREFKSLSVLNEMINFIIRNIGVMASINGSNPFGQGSNPWRRANIVGEWINFQPPFKYNMGVLSNWLARLIVAQVLIAWGFESLRSHFNLNQFVKIFHKLLNFYKS